MTAPASAVIMVKMSTRPRRSVADRLEELFQSGGYLAVRPPEILANLAPRYRWEFTRRHPYYLVAWEEVRRRRHGEPVDDFVETLTGLVGEAALLAIGVSGEPVDPAIEFDDPAFGGNDPFLITGACQPVTLRALAILLMQALPPADRAVVGAMLTTSGTREYRDVQSDQSWQAWGAQQLRQLPSAALNSYPLYPLFHLNLGSSQRTILEDVTTQLQLRQRGQATARATRPEILDSYLAVWDQREGWTGSRYSRRATKRFAEIAGTRAGRQQISTAFDRYRRAFELITGHPYSFALWFGLFGFLTFNRYLGDPQDWEPPQDSESRQKQRKSFRMNRHSRRDTTAESAAPDFAATAMPERPAIDVTSAPDIPAGYDETDLINDLQSLFAGGRSDEEIAAELGVSDVRLVTHVRDRWAEAQELEP